MTAYLTGILWWILVEVEFKNQDIFEDATGTNFIQEMGLYTQTNMYNAIAMFYFAITTLTTVGFGDYRPFSTYERALGSLLLFGGVLTFSYIIGNFLEVIDEL